MQPPDQNALREHGAKADEREEERVGGGASPETRAAEEREVDQQPRECGVSQPQTRQRLGSALGSPKGPRSWSCSTAAFIIV